MGVRPDWVGRSEAEDEAQGTVEPTGFPPGKQEEGGGDTERRGELTSGS